jgi:hypothetical protein
MATTSDTSGRRAAPAVPCAHDDDRPSCHGLEARPYAPAVAALVGEPLRDGRAPVGGRQSRRVINNAAPPPIATDAAAIARLTTEPEPRLSPSSA